MRAPLKNNERLLVKLRAGYLRARASGRRVLLAVSGGADSLALLDATTTLAPSLRLHCEVACIDHGLRPESALELAQVEREARARQLSFHSMRVNVPRGSSLEERARQERYNALQRIRVRAELDLIATAHHVGDQAETVLMRLARGTSLSGAAAIRAERGTLIRPMLACTRDEIHAHLAARNIHFAEDPMNADPTFLRTRMRRNVLPALEAAAGPGVARRIARFAELAAEDSELLDEWADAAHRRLRLAGGEIDAVGLRALPAPLRRRIIARLVADAGLALDAELVERVERALLGERSGATLPRGGVLRVTGGRVRIDTRAAETRELSSARLELDGEPLALPEHGRCLAWTSAPGGLRPQAIVPSSTGVLIVRRRRPGDRVRLHSGRTRKLQDVLTDARVPREKRNSLVVLADEDGLVVCVPGVWPRPGMRVRTAAASWLVDAPLVSDRAGPVTMRYKGAREGR